MLKAHSLKLLDVHLSRKKCMCPTYDDNLSPKIEKPSFVSHGDLVTYIKFYCFWVFVEVNVIFTFIGLLY